MSEHLPLAAPRAAPVASRPPPASAAAVTAGLLPARSGRAPLRPEQVLGLQRALGNRAVQRLLAARHAPDAQPLQRVVVPIPTQGLAYGSQEQREDEADIARGASGLERRDGGHVQAEGRTPLAAIPNGQKIYLHGHGAPGDLGGRTAAELLEGLKDMGLRKDYTGTIVLAACQSGVRTGPLGLGASLAGELAGLLSGEEYSARVEGMTGNVIIDHNTGEIRIVTDQSAFDAAREEWLPRNQAYMARQAAYDRNPVGPPTALNDERAALAREQRAWVERYTVAYEDGGTVLRGESDSRMLLAGGLVVGLLAAGLGLFAHYRRG